MRIDGLPASSTVTRKPLSISNLQYAAPINSPALTPAFNCLRASLVGVTG